MRLAVALCVLGLGACGRSTEVRADDPAHLAEDVARALRPAARAWLADAESRDESATLGHPSSADISAQAITFQRLVQRSRGLLEPYLPAATRGMPLPADESAVLRGLAAELGAPGRLEIAAELLGRTPTSARVRLTLLPQEGPPSGWRLDLAFAGGAWSFASVPRRE